MKPTLSRPQSFQSTHNKGIYTEHTGNTVDYRYNAVKYMYNKIFLIKQCSDKGKA